MAYDRAKSARAALQRELAEGCIEMYQHPNGDMLELIDIANRLLLLDGEATDEFLRQRARKCAEAPSNEPTPEFPARLHSHTLDMVPLRERALTEAERYQLAQYMTAPVVSQWDLIAYYPAIFGLGACAIAAFGDNEPGYWLTGLILLIPTMCSLYCWVRHRRKFGVLQSDLDRGVVILLEPQHAASLEVAGGEPLMETLEILPNSGLVWREGDKPAGWRRAV
jgi:hypothetical protein